MVYRERQKCLIERAILIAEFWFYVCEWMLFLFCSFNKPISLANLFAAISSFFDRFRISEDSCPQSRSSLPSKQSRTPLQTNDISIQESGSDLQLNWPGRHRDIGIWLFGYEAAFFKFHWCASMCMCARVVFQFNFYFSILIFGMLLILMCGQGGSRWVSMKQFR